jgi:ATP-binding cassette subfamily B protein
VLLSKHFAVGLSPIRSILHDEIARVKKALTPPELRSGGIDNVSYSYPERKEKALENISFQIRSREKIAIVGLNGAGKTTLMKLLLRLLDPDAGAIRFRGVNLKAWDARAFRKTFGVVFQDFSKFKLTLYENIALALTAGLLLIIVMLSSAPRG